MVTLSEKELKVKLNMVPTPIWFGSTAFENMNYI